ncbi:hypothetical protein BK138_34165 [Paenibacillus rhizosphaerae]|uniref:Uncharacterized protein n=1 Tax=Paenibacillus rhizosphaerae TaxID=297318 RepID=A0A1R1DZR6_9BACL|nr:hypothetical protein BK138_34165 [Paenibacillus rhizosphaerae]
METKTKKKWIQGHIAVQWILIYWTLFHFALKGTVYIEINNHVQVNTLFPLLVALTNLIVLYRKKAQHAHQFCQSIIAQPRNPRLA